MGNVSEATEIHEEPEPMGFALLADGKCALKFCGEEVLETLEKHAMENYMGTSKEEQEAALFWIEKRKKG